MATGGKLAARSRFCAGCGPGEWHNAIRLSSNAWASIQMGFEVMWVWSPDTQGLPHWLRLAFLQAYFITVVSVLR
jgi:hypothetical protein